MSRTVTAGPRKGANRYQAARRAAALGAAVASVGVLAGPAAANVGVANSGIGIHGGASPAGTTFPGWYQDADGMQLVPCTSAPQCAFAGVAMGAFFDEAFYSSVNASVAGVALRLDQEMTYDGDPGTEGVFGRMRIRGPIAPGWYRITTPYGSKDLLAGGGGLNDTVDVGCGPAIGTPCAADADYGIVGGSEIGPNFLQWDQGPGGGVAPDAGFVGDGATPHKIVGSTFYAPGETTAANYYRIERITGSGGSVISEVGRTDEFTVVGQLLNNGAARGQLASGGGDLGSARINTTTPAQTVTLTNRGGASVTNAAVAVTGDAADFTLSGTTCANTGVNVGNSCTASITFHPTTTGVKNAALAVTDPGGKVRSYPLRALGTNPVPTAPASVNYGTQLVGSSTGRTVTLSNTGTAPFAVNNVAIAGGGGQYVLGNDVCSGRTLAPGASCTIEAFFTPSAPGAQTAALNIATDAGTRSVTLNGAGSAQATAPGGIGLATGGGTGAGPGAGGPAPSGSSLAPLKLKQLIFSSRLKRRTVARKGVRIVARLQSGTHTLRIRIYRKKNGRKTVVAQGFRAPAASGLYRTVLKDKKMRRKLTVGSYELEVTPGRSSSDMGTPSRYAFKIVK